MSHNEKDQHPRQSPVHDPRESQPGLDSLAPEDNSHRPSLSPAPPANSPPRRGSLKAPDTEKLDALDPFRKGGENFPRPPIRVYASPTIKIHCAPARAVPRCWKILSCARKLPTSTTSAFRNG